MSKSDAQFQAQSIALRLKAAGVTQSQIGDALGVTQSQISRLWRGRSKAGQNCWKSYVFMQIQD